MYQPMIQVGWFIHALWLEKFQWPQHLQSYFQRLLLVSLLALSFISFFFVGGFELEGFATAFMLGAYFVTCAWIGCELRIAESSLKVRLFIRFLFSSAVFAAATTVYFLYDRIYDGLHDIIPYHGGPHATPYYLYMLLIYITLLLWSLVSLVYKITTTLYKLLGFLFPSVIVTRLDPSGSPN